MKRNWIKARSDNGHDLFLTPNEMSRAKKRYDSEVKAVQKRRKQYKR